jgi:hypothetical protein
VATWRQRFAAKRLDGLADEPRPGAPRRIWDEKILDRTLASFDSRARRLLPGPHSFLDQESSTNLQMRLFVRKARRAWHLARETLVKPEVGRKEIAQLRHRRMIMENFRSSGFIFANEVDRSIQLSARRSWGDADASQGRRPILRQPVISSNKVKLCHVDITKIYGRVQRVNAWNSSKFDKGKTVGNDVLMQSIVGILRRPKEELRDSTADRLSQDGGTDVGRNPFVFGDPEMADDGSLVRQSQRILLSAPVEEPVWIDIHRRYGIVGPIAVISEHEIVREELRNRRAHRGPTRFGRVDENQSELWHHRSAVIKQETTPSISTRQPQAPARFIARPYRGPAAGAHASKCMSNASWDPKLI